MKFRFSPDLVIDSEKDPWRREGIRIAMLGGPGSGKSWNNSLFAEQFLTQAGTVVIFQPRDEYFTLKEKFDILSVGGVHAKDMDFALTSPSIYAKAVVEDGISMIFYTSGLDEERLVSWVARFIHHLLTLQEIHKRPLLIILEEAHEYTPQSSRGHVAPPWVYSRMIKAFKDCSTQGRKLNIIQLVSSQRPQELNFTIRQLANLTFYGKFSDQDIGYVDKECLKYVRKQGIAVDASRLVDLALGEWLVIMGKQTKFITVTEQRLTKHGAETPRLEYVAPRATETKKTIDQLSKAVMEALQKEEAEKSELEKAKRKIRDLTDKLDAAEEKGRIKLSVKEMLLSGSGAQELAEKLAKAETEIKDLRKKLVAKKSPEEIEELHKTIDNLKKAYEISENQQKELEPKAWAFEKLQEALAPFMLATPPPGFEPGPPSEIGVQHAEIGLQHTMTIVDVPKAIKELAISDETLRGKILRLAETGFLNNWSGLGDVHTALIETFGWTIAKASLSGELERMAKDFLLGVKRDPRRKQKVYRLAENVKFKEAEA